MSPARPQVIVLGGGYAGVLAARRIARSADADVTLLNRRSTFVERIRLHQRAAGLQLPARPISTWLGAARLRTGEVRGIDVARRRIELADGAMSCDRLVIALGSATRCEVPGAEHALRLDDPETATAVGVAAAQAAASGRPLAVVGGGLTAIEAATELAEAYRGLRVLVLCRGGLGDGSLGPDAIAHVRRAFARRAIELREHSPVDGLEPGLLCVKGESIAVAAALWCAGFAASPLAAAAGLATDPLGRMLVDDDLTVPGAPWIYGAGDAAVPRRPVGAPIVMACKTAMPMAACAADNLIASLAERPGRAFRFGDSGVCVSLGRTDAVIQRRDAAGHNRGVTRGRVGAMIKESICRFTTRALRFRSWQGVYRLYARAGQRALAASVPSPAATVTITATATSTSPDPP